jgi:hypothetical protein
MESPTDTVIGTIIVLLEDAADANAYFTWLANENNDPAAVGTDFCMRVKAFDEITNEHVAYIESGGMPRWMLDAAVNMGFVPPEPEPDVVEEP